MSIQEFNLSTLKQLNLPSQIGKKASNGQITIIAGSELFHGPALFALKITTALSDMVYFTSPEPRFSDIAYQIKTSINNFIWVPLNEINEYINKSQSVLIGPGLMRFHNENHEQHNTPDEITIQSQRLTTELLTTHPNTNWIIDAGSLQVIKAHHLPPNSIITPNPKEFAILFNKELPIDQNEKILMLESLSKQYNIHIVAKGHPTIVSSPNSEITIVSTQSIGLTKGGGGDCLSALITAFRAYNLPHMSAISADYLIKQTSLRLSKIKGPLFTTDELVDYLPLTIYDYLTS